MAMQVSIVFGANRLVGNRDLEIDGRANFQTAAIEPEIHTRSADVRRGTHWNAGTPQYLQR
jgi:hypothetical protein